MRYIGVWCTCICLDSVVGVDTYLMYSLFELRMLYIVVWVRAWAFYHCRKVDDFSNNFALPQSVHVYILCWYFRFLFLFLFTFFYSTREAQFLFLSLICKDTIVILIEDCLNACFFLLIFCCFSFRFVTLPNIIQMNWTFFFNFFPLQCYFTEFGCFVV